MWLVYHVYNDGNNWDPVAAFNKKEDAEAEAQHYNHAFIRYHEKLAGDCEWTKPWLHQK